MGLYNILKAGRFFVALIATTFFLCSADAAQKRIGEKIEFQTTDGVRIIGLYKAPAGKKVHTFVLLHGLGSNQEEWQGFVAALIKQGYGFLSYDARGHGESISLANGSKIGYESFGGPSAGSNWEKMLQDVDLAIKFLVEKKGLSYDKIGLMGASLGANLSLVYASLKPSIKPVVLLSPGINYVGINTKKAIIAFKPQNKVARPLLLVSSPGDTYSNQSSLLLFKQIESNKNALSLLGTGSNHGVQMLDKKMTLEIIKWVNKSVYK